MQVQGGPGGCLQTLLQRPLVWLCIWDSELRPHLSGRVIFMRGEVLCKLAAEADFLATLYMSCFLRPQKAGHHHPMELRLQRMQS